MIEIDLSQLDSKQLFEQLEEMKGLILSISDQYAEALNNLKALESMEDCRKSEIVCKFLDRNKKYNESLRRAEASEEFKDYKNQIIAARDLVTPLEIRFRAFNHIIDAITAVAYVKNSEIKKGL